MLPYNKANVLLARQLRAQATPWERRLWRHFLQSHHVRWQRQKPILDYIVDFYCDKAKLIVELDGGGHYTKEQRVADERRTRDLQRLGLTVLRYANSDVDVHFEAVCASIEAEVKRRLGRSN
ncbi:endonuclease domain-containing protein [Bifidobacterium simiarum]|uniref:Endonuclease n=1 Tax=Bifidobacterium simiarum TaxID=2045441 RepID=A0A2M9HGP7_9BIFI|nr:endonuclease domain-containing protein [Bifidobacterium simiarum]PJM75998.1 endonuclease [Bifidobacterium simiarum]